MDVLVYQSEINNPVVQAISSKSYVHRLLIAAALSKNVTQVNTNIVSKDMKATVDCLINLGADIEINEEGFLIKKPVSKGASTLVDCNESGSTARFLLPLSIYLYENVRMEGHGKLPERPFGPLCDCLRENGAVINSDYLPIEASGEIKSGKYTIPGNISSQYISGLLFLLPLLEDDSELVITESMESVGYIDMTLEVLNTFNIKIIKTDYGFMVPGNQVYDGPSVIDAEGDWSNAAYVLSMAAIRGSMTMTGINPLSIQGDREYIDILKAFGASVELDLINNTIKVTHSSLKAIDIDASQIPDLVPALAVIASHAKGETVFRNVQRLRIKECDRIEAIEKLLDAIYVETKVVERENATDLYVIGKPDINRLNYVENVPVDGYNDHRIVMAAAVAAIMEANPLKIEGAQAVAKSYPTFFEVCKEMGINIEVSKEI